MKKKRGTRKRRQERGRSRRRRNSSRRRNDDDTDDDDDDGNNNDEGDDENDELLRTGEFCDGQPFCNGKESRTDEEKEQQTLTEDRTTEAAKCLHASADDR